MPIWRFRGSPHYLQAQGDRLGVSRVLVDQAGKNAEIHRVSALAGQLCERYHRGPKDPDGTSAVGPAEKAQVRGTLGQCELEVQKLHMLAAAAAAIIGEVHRAFGIEAPGRDFVVTSIYDPGSRPGLCSAGPSGRIEETIDHPPEGNPAVAQQRDETRDRC